VTHPPLTAIITPSKGRPAPVSTEIPLGTLSNLVIEPRAFSFDSRFYLLHGRDGARRPHVADADVAGAGALDSNYHDGDSIDWLLD